MQSHHSHSGGRARPFFPFCFILYLITEFCSHAVDTLEDVIQQAIRQKFNTFALTEHMPRDTLNDLYPEEVLPRNCKL
jgi:HisJ family histidinol phosphate phosphatase